MPETNELLRLLPLLKGIPAACLLALVLVGPLDLGGLTQATGYTRGRVAEALRTLETLGLICTAGEDWTASASLAERLSRLNFFAGESRVSESQSLESLKSESQSQETQDSETQDSDIKDSETQDSETGDSETQSERVISKILSLTPQLFEEPVLLPAGLQVPVDELLAQLGEVYINRARLRYPARVVAANLRNGRPASRRFLAQPRAYLPAGFLRQMDEALEVITHKNSAYSHGWKPAELDDKVLETCPAPEPSETERLWRAARDELQLSLPKATYESYVRPLSALDYDVEQRQLFLEAPDGQTCRWLDGRLKRILERLMVGITGEAVEVVFLPPEETSAGGGV